MPHAPMLIPRERQTIRKDVFFDASYLAHQRKTPAQPSSIRRWELLAEEALVDAALDSRLGVRLRTDLHNEKLSAGEYFAIPRFESSHI